MDPTPIHTEPTYSAYTMPSLDGGWGLVIALSGFRTSEEARRACEWIMGPFCDEDAEEVDLH